MGTLASSESKMAHIPLPPDLPGIRGPMAFRPETAGPLNELVDVYRSEVWVMPERGEWPMHFFELPHDTVWGATARILRQLLTLLTFT